MISDAEVEAMRDPREPSPRLPLSIILVALGLLLTVVAGYTDMRITSAVQGEQIATLRRDFAAFESDFRSAFHIEHQAAKK